MIKILIYIGAINYILSFSAYAQQVLHTVWGDYKIADTIVEELIQSKTMQRIQQIDQSGPPPYLGLIPFFSRYDHSIGVFVLLHKAGVSKIEQIAGLLHDSSHTVFSHLGDDLFYEANLNKSYQDTIHIEFLKKMNIEKITKKYNISLKELDPDNPVYTALERALPELCADRIEYNIHTGVLLGIISDYDAKNIVDNLQFIDNKWFFTDKKIAKKFADLSIYFTKNFWGSGWNSIIYNCFSSILRRAIDIKLITKDEMHFGVDKIVFDKFKDSKDHIIQKLFAEYKYRIKSYEIVEFGKGEINIRPKLRAIDPLVCIKRKCHNLSVIDNEFRRQFNLIRKWCQKGYGINFRGFILSDSNSSYYNRKDTLD